MAIAKFTIEMAADLGQLKRDVQNINTVVSKLGSDIAKHYAPGVAALDQLGAAHTKVADKAQMSAMAQRKAANQVMQQNIQLSNQIQDFGIQIAGGQNPLLAFVQQGSQLTAVYGGVRPALAAVTALLTPMTLGLTAGAAAVGGLAYAFVQGSNQSAEFRRSLELTGNVAGLTADSYEAMIARVAVANKQGAGDVRDTAQALVSTGRFGPAQIEQMTQTAAMMVKITGKTAEQVAQEFAQMADAPAAYAASANKSLHFLTDAELRYIQKLEANGKRQEAVYAVAEAMQTRYGAKTAENMGYIGKSLASAKKEWNDFWDAAYGLGRESSDAEVVTRLQNIINAKQQALGSLDPGSKAARVVGDELKKAQAELGEYQQKQSAAETEVASKAKAAAAEQAATEKRAMDSRLKGAGESLAAAASELLTKRDLAAADGEILRLQGEQARAASQSPAVEAYYKEAIAKQELLKLDAQRAAVQRDLGRVQGGDKPEDNLAAEQKRLQLQGRLIDLDTQRNKLQGQLQVDLRATAQKQTEQDGAAADAREEARGSLGAYVVQLAQTRTELEAQAKTIGLTVLEQDKLTFACGLSARAAQLELEWTDKATKAGLGQADVQEGLLAIRREQAKALEAYGVLHANEYDKMYNAQRGATDGIKDYMEASAKAGEGAREAVGNVTRSMEDALTKFAATGKLDIKGFIDTVIAEFARLAVVKPLVESLLNAGAGDFIAKLFGGGGGYSGMSNTNSNAGTSTGIKFANGGAFAQSKAITAFAKGGAFTNSVVSSPTLFKFANGAKMGVMGEAGAEAIMPLQRDSRGRLGVKAMLQNSLAQGGGGGVVVHVNVINQAGAALQTESTRTRRNADGSLSVDVMVRQLQDALADNVAAGSGSLYAAIGNRFTPRGSN
jgi:lambda family phage tail tape measure protein